MVYKFIVFVVSLSIAVNHCFIVPNLKVNVGCTHAIVVSNHVVSLEMSPGLRVAWQQKSTHLKSIVDRVKYSVIYSFKVPTCTLLRCN